MNNYNSQRNLKVYKVAANISLTMIIVFVFVMTMCVYDLHNHNVLAEEGIIITATYYSLNRIPANGEKSPVNYIEWEYNGKYYSDSYSSSLQGAIIGTTHKIYIDKENPENYSLLENNILETMGAGAIGVFIFSALYFPLKKIIKVELQSNSGYSY